MKKLIRLFAIISIMLIPTFYIYYKGGAYNGVTLTSMPFNLNVKLGSLSLGNLGHA